MKLSFALNGERIDMDAPDDRRVVDILREDLGLTGTKEGCGSGECGACAILVDNESKLSCLMVAAQVQDRRITTIEGIAPKDEYHPVQEAFIEKGAVQCGFCSPGMIIGAIDMLNRNPCPSREEIREGLSGNICRCTGYQKIVDAVETVAGRKEDPS